MKIKSTRNLEDKLTQIEITFSSEEDINLLRDAVALANAQLPFYEEYASGLPEMLHTIKESL